MRFGDFVAAVVGEAESCGVEFVVVGAVACGAYGVPRAGRSLGMLAGAGAVRLVRRLARVVEWDPQVDMDAVTWTARHCGRWRGEPAYGVEVIECGGDEFSRGQLGGRERVRVPWLGCAVWLPRREDVVIDALRRGVDGGVVRDVVEGGGGCAPDGRHLARWCGRLGMEVPVWLPQAAG